MAWPPHITVATIVRRGDRYLVVEEGPENARVINQPAGHLDPGETLLEAAVRETLEETGWHVSLTGLTGIYQYYSPTADITYQRFAFTAEARVESGQPLDPDIHRVHWLTREEIATRPQRSPLVLRCIDDALLGEAVDLGLIRHL